MTSSSGTTADRRQSALRTGHIEESEPSDSRQPFSMFSLVTGSFTATDARDSAIMLDVGAQRGQYSRAFAALGFDVRAFEASPVNFDDLVERMKRYPSVTPVHVAVSDSDADEVPFYFSEEFIGVNSLKVNSSHLDAKKFALVPTVRLDTYLGHDSARVKVIKTDIEGADLLALRGFDFERYTPQLVVCEYGGRSQAFGYGVQDLVDYMRQYRYVAWCSSYDSGTGLPYSAKTGEQAPVALRYFGAFDRCRDPNWGDLLFFPPEARARLAHHLDAFDLGAALVDVAP